MLRDLALDFYFKQYDFRVVPILFETEFFCSP
jgi:hypothetical protein